MKTKRMFLALSLAWQICALPLSDGGAEPMPSRDSGSMREILALLPAKNSMSVVASQRIAAGERIIAQLVIYDDPTTKRPADYMELMSRWGGVIAAVWFDRFGIERMVVDRGLLDEKDQLEGVLVLVLAGVAV